MQLLVRLFSQLVNHIFILAHNCPQDGMRESVAVNKDPNTHISIAGVSDSPVLGCEGNVVGLDALAIAGLVVADEERNIL